MYIEQFKCILYVCVCVLLQMVSVAVALIVPSELEAMHTYSPESWKLIGWISKPPDCSSVNLGTWTEPLAKTCDPTETENYKIALRSIKVIKSFSKFLITDTLRQCVCVCVFAQSVMQSVWYLTFPPGDGGFWRSVRLAGKQSCVPISYCLVRRGECKCGGHTWNTGREHETKEDREMATEKRLVKKQWKKGKGKTQEWKEKREQCWSKHNVWSMEALFIT